MTTVTQNGMVSSQPGTAVSVTSPYNGGVRLNVSRYYDDLPNKFGGRGVHKSLDCDGLIFKTSQEAFDFAFKRGYTRTYYSSPDLRAKRVKDGVRRKELAMSME
jgi:hypothetical protein